MFGLVLELELMFEFQLVLGSDLLLPKGLVLELEFVLVSRLPLE